MKEKTLLLYRIVCFQMPNRKAIMPDEACLRFKWFCEQIPLSPKYTLQRGSFVTIFYIIHGYLALSTKKDFSCKSQGSNGGGGRDPQGWRTCSSQRLLDQRICCKAGVRTRVTSVLEDLSHLFL